MSTRFADLIAMADNVEQFVRRLQQRLQPYKDGERFTPEMKGAVENAAQRITTTIKNDIVNSRPKDATEDEWNATPVAMLRARLESLELAAQQRPVDTEDWFNELLLACEEFQQSYETFNRRIER